MRLSTERNSENELQKIKIKQIEIDKNKMQSVFFLVSCSWCANANASVLTSVNYMPMGIVEFWSCCVICFFFFRFFVVVKKRNAVCGATTASVNVSQLSRKNYKRQNVKQKPNPEWYSTGDWIVVRFYLHITVRVGCLLAQSDSMAISSRTHEVGGKRKLN